MIDRNESSAGQTANLNLGQQLRFALPENVTTGYRWHLASPCPTILDLTADQPGPAAFTPGAGNTHTWVFSANSQGRCDLRFEYARPWEKTPPAKLLTFPVSVQPGS